MNFVRQFLKIALLVVTCELAGQDNKSPSEVFDSLACRCQMPKIAEVGSGEVEFSAGFDWNEYRRTFRMLKDLPSQTDRIWNLLVERIEDERYVSTVATGSGAKVNLTIGSVSTMLVRGTLTQPFLKTVPISINRRIVASELNPNFFESPTKLKQWLWDRKDVPIYKLQIELCEWAKGEIRKGKVTGIDERELDKWVREIDVTVMNLSNEKRTISTNVFAALESLDPN